MALLVVVAPAEPLAQPGELGGRPRAVRASQAAIALSFHPVAVEPLAVGKPQNQWLNAKTVQFRPVPKVHEDDRRQQPAIIHLFVDPTDKGVNTGRRFTDLWRIIRCFTISEMSALTGL